MNTRFLFDLLCQPTAPFREQFVAARLRAFLDENDVPYFSDPYSNLIVGVGSPAEYRKLVAKKTGEPVRLFMAHLDHPGFHGVSWLSPRRLEVRWHGGSPQKHIVGAKVWIADDTGPLPAGRFTKVKMVPTGRGPMIESGIVQLDERPENQPDPETLFGGFGFRAPVWKQGQLLYTKAADDLIGAFAIVTLATKVKRGNFLGLLTRAEEVGLLGALAHLELGWLDKATRPCLAISLETSRQLPGAQIGKGPVVRLGDRATTFDPGALQVFSQVASRRLPGKHQRRVMDGGTCEATVAVTLGYPAIGISIPLGNYHNQSFEGGPDSRGTNGPAPEFVHLGDLQGMLDLGEALLEPGLPWKQPFGSKLEGLRRGKRGYRDLHRRFRQI